MNVIRNRQQSLSTLGLILLLGLLLPLSGFAQVDKSLFSERDLKKVISKSTDNANVLVSDKVTIIAPRIAENGSEVGVRVKSSLKNVEKIMLFSDTNHYPLVASYAISKQAAPVIRSRIKIGKNSNVIAIVKADGKYYSAKQLVKVTIGGCGGGAGPDKPVEVSSASDKTKDKK